MPTNNIGVYIFSIRLLHSRNQLFQFSKPKIGAYPRKGMPRLMFWTKYVENYTRS